MPDSKIQTCPCGSGRSFESCCGRTSLTLAKLKKIGVWVGILAVTGIVTAVALSFDSNKPGVLTPAKVTQPPQPWEYNPITNQHWDPRPGHEHWHAGPPPSDPTAAVQDSGGVTPQPYEYDAINDRYWDPAHAHWHSGRPPSN